MSSTCKTQPVPNSDRYEDAIDALTVLCNQLYGGHYEPRSRRDLWLADKIAELLFLIKER